MPRVTEHGTVAIKNVYIFVADSLRWDHLPESVAERGVTAKTVAQSTFSAPSFATLATGRYPIEHGVHNWPDRINQNVQTVFELDGVSGGFWQSGEEAGHEIYPILRQSGKTTLDDVEPPFFFVHRNDDPHVPFAGSNEPTAEAYYESRGRNIERIRADYQRGVEHSVKAFEDVLDDLTKRDLLEETLVVFTSDHGEVLGEHGEHGHGAPACPELVYVPTVLIHPSLSASDLTVDTETDIIEHVDVLETALSAAGLGDRLRTSGMNLLEDNRLRDWGYSHVNIVRRDRQFYGSESLWWRDGGYVWTTNSRFLRAVYAASQLGRSATRHAVRVSPVQLFETYLTATHTYGSPLMDRERARQALDDFQDELEEREGDQVELGTDVEQTLEDMGYL